MNSDVVLFGIPRSSIPVNKPINRPLLIKFKEKDGAFGVCRQDVKVLSLVFGVPESDVVQLAIRLLWNQVASDQITNARQILADIEHSKQQGRKAAAPNAESVA